MKRKTFYIVVLDNRTCYLGKDGHAHDGSYENVAERFATEDDARSALSIADVDSVSCEIRKIKI